MKDTKIQIKESKHTNLFQIVKQKEGYKIVTGNYIASARTFNTITEAENYIGSKPWELIYNTIAIFRSYEKEMEKMAKQNSQNNEKN